MRYNEVVLGTLVRAYGEDYERNYGDRTYPVGIVATNFFDSPSLPWDNGICTWNINNEAEYELLI